MKYDLLLILACLTGFFGDFLLQVLTKTTLGGSTGWGLKEYFKQHGKAESLFIASGMMTLFYVMYLTPSLLGYKFLPLSLIGLAIFGIVLDFIFRKTELFPSLKGYYNHLNYFWSAFWGAVPMIIPLVLYKLING
jgi:hypothetical protein